MGNLKPKNIYMVLINGDLAPPSFLWIDYHDKVVD